MSSAVTTPVRTGYWRSFGYWFFGLVLLVSLLTNLGIFLFWYYSGSDSLEEVFYSGTESAEKKIALIRISGTIMPPFTSRIIKRIEQAGEDDSVLGVLLVINSPGGLVADSHQIYHRLKQLSAKKPVTVAMQSMAASGGYYVAMGAGENATIFAEPTTWTGSIGVIIPRFEFSNPEGTGLADKLGIKSAPIKTGPFKDSLSPFRTLPEEELALWKDIIGQSYEQFLTVIDEGRANLDLEEVRKLATGRIFTAKDALANGLVDQIGYEEEALEHLQTQLGLDEVRVVTYSQTSGLLDVFLEMIKSSEPAIQQQALLDWSVPRAMYFCSWAPPLPLVE